jgi:photoactive yellow protein
MDDTGTVPRAWPVGSPPSFLDPGLLELLEATSVEDFDELDFGLITMDRHGVVIGYNANESIRSGIRRDRVMGRDLFVDVAPCVNNYLVAERYWSEDALDEQLDYVFTFRMRPTPVRLRLLAAAGSDRQYLAVRSR